MTNVLTTSEYLVPKDFQTVIQIPEEDSDHEVVNFDEYEEEPSITMRKQKATQNYLFNCIYVI